MTAKLSTSVHSCVASPRPPVNGTVDVEAGILRRFLDRRGAGKNDRIGHRQRATQLVDLGENVGQFAGLVDRPLLLRSEPDARAIGAAAVIGLAIGRGRRPGRLDQLADAEARAEDLRLERRDIGVATVWRRPEPDPARSALPPGLPARGSEPSGPCRGGSA